MSRSLARTSRAETAVELLRRRELVTVLDVLAGHEIRPVLLKGAPLAYTLYPTPSSRPHDDVDLMIRRSDVERVANALSARGYIAPTYCGGELLFCQTQLSRRDEFGVSHDLDLHWKVSTQSVFADLLTYDELDQDSEPVPALGPHARAAGRIHALIVACAHPVMHHRNVERLIWTHDVHLLASRLTADEFRQFALLAQARRVGAICARQLALARARFGTQLPIEATAQLATFGLEPSTAYLSTGRRWHNELVSSLRGLPDWGSRMRLLREIFLPSSRYMYAAYGIEPDDWGRASLPGLYVHRTVRGAWRLVLAKK
ncbi:MAG: nucleotidyltransferase family protein [Acidimicrobiia bacterium]|nr:nucleotidyltransferase family protein [Acidimicrobiia bacterium]